MMFDKIKLGAIALLGILIAILFLCYKNTKSQRDAYKLELSSCQSSISLQNQGILDLKRAAEIDAEKQAAAEKRANAKYYEAQKQVNKIMTSKAAPGCLNPADCCLKSNLWAIEQAKGMKP